MKAVPDSMLWVSYVTHRDGPRHEALDRAVRQRIRLLTSQYILGELNGSSRRSSKNRADSFSWHCRKSCACWRRASAARPYVAADPNDDPVVQTALTGKADVLI